MKILAIGVGIGHLEVSSGPELGITFEVSLDLFVTVSFGDSTADDMSLLKVNNTLLAPS